MTKPPLIIMSGVVNTDNSRYIANRSNCTVHGYWKIMFGKFPVMTSVRDSEKQRLKIFLALGLNEKI